MSNRETIRALVTEELMRPEVQDALMEAQLKNGLSKLWDHLRHPLVLTIVGFLLTATVGTYLESLFSASADDRARREAQIQSALAAEARAQDSLLALTRLAQERITRANLLRSAIGRDASSLQARKAAYDKAYVAWNVELTPHLIRVREDFSDSPDGILAPHFYEEMINNRVSSGRGGFGRSDACLTNAFDDRMRARRAGEDFKPRQCRGEGWHAFSVREVQRAKNCIEAVLADGFAVARDRAKRKIAIARGVVATSEPRLPDTTNLERACG
ncbi:hypothetical protein ACS3SW_18080 [Roseobacteraceae bacterium S113]